MANVSIVEVDGGYVVIDTASNPDIAQRIRTALEQRVSGKPLAIIFTHSHPDHTGGAEAFIGEGIPIWAHDKFAEELELYQLLPNSHFVRGAKQFGAWLPHGTRASGHIGPALQFGDGKRAPIYVPTHTFSGSITLTIGGTKIVLYEAPGETQDHLFVWLPEHRVIFAADNIYRAFPNLYALRGVPPRPIKGWIRSLDSIRRLDPQPEAMFLGHTEPVFGTERIHSLVTDYRDAISWVHDSVIRGLNAAKSPDQLIEEIRLPKHLQGHPYLEERYGTVSHSVRGIYHSYVGWFDGEPANLNPMPRTRLSKYLIPALGGKARVEALLKSAAVDDDPQWALWLNNLLLADDDQSTWAKHLKASLLSRMASDTHNHLHRNWLNTDAALLSGKVQPCQPVIDYPTIFQLPVENILEVLSSRINSKRAENVVACFGFDFTDTNKQYTFYVRHGVGELAPSLDDGCSLIIQSTEAKFKQWIVARSSKRYSREFRKHVRFYSMRKGWFSSFRMLRSLVLLRRCLDAP